MHEEKKFAHNLFSHCFVFYETKKQFIILFLRKIIRENFLWFNYGEIKMIVLVPHCKTLGGHATIITLVYNISPINPLPFI